MTRVAALLLSAAFLPGVVAQPCITFGFKVDVPDACTFDALLTAFTPIFNDPINKGSGCTSNSAEQDLLKLIGASSKNAAKAAVKAICADGLDTYSETVPFHKIPGYGESFIANFFNGGSDWNVMRATEYPAKADGTPRHLLEEDAGHVKRFYEEKGQYGLVQWPDQLPNFSQCEMNAAYCCWTSDRQAGDNNGNCEEPYDENCVDADPADNTDLCFVDLEDGATTLGRNADSGMFFFPHDDRNNNNEKRNAEGPIHCHGVGWADDVLDPSGVYKGNNLFYVSMYDHMYKRGYVRNVPGAPMCGCAEQMPVVTRSDCTQMEVDQAFEFTYDGSAFSARVTKIDIDFQSCEGIDRYGEDDSNDLWSYMNRLYTEDKISSQTLRDLNSKLVGDDPNMCLFAQNKHMAQKGYTVGHSTNWAQLAGREALSMATPVGKSTFTTLYDSSTSKIFKRICPNCYESHRTLFYKRKKAIPAGFDLLGNLLYSNELQVGNEWNKDFEIYSTFEDAMAGVNPWSCPAGGFNYEEGFPGECGPDGETTNQESRFNHGYWGGQQDVSWYLDASSPFNTLSSEIIGDPPEWFAPDVTASITEANGKLFMTTNAVDMKGQHDNLQFWATEYAADVEVIVRLETFHILSGWSKTGILIRDSATGAGSKYFSIIVSGKNGVYSQWREGTDEDSHSNLQVWDDSIEFNSPVWLRVLKQGDLFSAYHSTDGTNWEMRTSMEISMTGSVFAGLGLSANHWSQHVAEAIYTDFEATEYVWPSSAPSLTPAPTSYSTVQRIGTANDGMPGKTSVDASGRSHVAMSVGHLGGTKDAFYFSPLPHTGDFSVRGFIKSFDTPNDWSKGGITIREPGVTGQEAQVSCVLQKSNGIYMSARVDGGNDSEYFGVKWGNYQDSGWCRLDKVGNSVTGYRSFDGMNWQKMETVTIGFGSDTVDVGVAASGSWNEYGTVTVENFEIVD